MAEDQQEFDLADVDDYARAIKEMGYAGTFSQQHGRVNANGLYCVRCGGERRMAIQRLWWKGESDEDRARFDIESQTVPGTPGLSMATCIQCELRHDVVVHTGPDGPEIAIFSPERGGFSTPNTPDGVKHYLDQAHRAESVGATSAAVTMYRSAFEMLLFQQSYVSGMLHKKIEDLLADANAPAWREQIDPDYLKVMKALGNAATHPNDGDIEKQKTLDRSLLIQVRAVFEELLDLVYERPVKEAERKARLTAAAESFAP